MKSLYILILFTSLQHVNAGRIAFEYTGRDPFVPVGYFRPGNTVKEGQNNPAKKQNLDASWFNVKGIIVASSGSSVILNDKEYSIGQKILIVNNNVTYNVFVKSIVDGKIKLVMDEQSIVLLFNPGSKK